MIWKNSMAIALLAHLLVLSSPLAAQNAETCEVEIKEPRTNQDVTLQGMIKVSAEIPTGDHLWVFVRPVYTYRTQEKWWPQGEPIQIDAAKEEWEHPATFGSPGQNFGHPFDVIAAIFGPQEHAQLKKLQENADLSKNYQPITMPVAVCASRMVTVTKRTD